MVSSGVHQDSKETWLYKTNIILQSTTLLFNKQKQRNTQSSVIFLPYFDFQSTTENKS